jgi:hypothetical protein
LAVLALVTSIAALTTAVAAVVVLVSALKASSRISACILERLNVISEGVMETEMGRVLREIDPEAGPLKVVPYSETREAYVETRMVREGRWEEYGGAAE